MIPAAVPDNFWRSLRYFSLYRFAVASLFLAAVELFGGEYNLGIQNEQLFSRAVWVYLLQSLIFLPLVWKRRGAFNLLLSIQVIADLAVFTVMMYASGGQKSGIATLILVTVAAAGLVGQGRMSLFFAATATVFVLMEESWRALTADADAADFVRTGLLCIGFFGTAITARLLAKRVVANEELAEMRGRALADQLRLGERIIRDMDSGVLVVDADDKVRQANQSARTLLDVDDAENASLKMLCPELFGFYATWRGSDREKTELLAVGERTLQARFVPSSEGGGHALIYLEDMARVQAQAQQMKLAALGRLTANMAHEIRNPLAAISHAAELLREDAGDPLRERLARIVHDNTGRLNRLVGEVLELGRRDRAQLEVLGWPGYARGFLDEFAMQNPAVRERICIGDGEAEFRFDRGHFHRVLWNLLSNALRHASDNPGAVKLWVVEESDGRISLHVVDDGAGIDGEIRGQVFEPFFTTRSDGTGLGLFIARELCEANGARLELVESAQGGAHFRILVEGA